MSHSKKNRDEKTIDLPPEGARNPDPLSDQPGSHPIETGVGAAVGGALSGLAVGMVAGPVGAVVGVVGGALAGGLAGKGLGELIDPTTEDNWIRDLLTRQPGRTQEWTDAARQAYRFGWHAEARYPGLTFAECEDSLKQDWHARNWAYKWEDHRDQVLEGFAKGRDVNGTNDRS